jgi:hypothetical protein
MSQIKGHYQFESSNTLRNSVLPQSIPKAERFKLDKRGGHFVELKDPSDLLTSMTQTQHVSIAQTTKAGKYGKEVSPTLSTRGGGGGHSKSPQSAHKRSSSSFFVRKDNVNIKIDEYVANGRPLWMNELRKMSPGPDVYVHKTEFDENTEEAERKPNKCLFGESFEKFKKVCDIDRSIKVFDTSKHYAAATVGYNRLSTDPISPLDTSVTRKKNNPVISMAQSKSILFGICNRISFIKFIRT